MKYRIEYRPRAIKDLRGLSADDAAHVLSKIEVLQSGLSADVKKLASFTPEYRLRAGDYRILFELQGDCVVVYRIKHRKDAYR